MGSNNIDVPYFPVKIITKLEEFTMECRADMKVQNLKWKIHNLKKIEPKQQRLFFEGIELEEPDYELSLYGIDPIEQNAEFKLMLVQFYQGIPQTYFLDESHYDPKWNSSFEGITINKSESKGGKPYIPPIGCVRYGVKEILKKGFLIEKGVRFAYGKGIYCSYDPRVALGYAHNYKFEDKNYKLIIQCRVDPKKLQIYGNYWLVTDEKHIRPYAICVFSEDGVKELDKYICKYGIVQFGGSMAPAFMSSNIQSVQPPPIQPMQNVQFQPSQTIQNDKQILQAKIATLSSKALPNGSK